jgi:hypothetical protein
VVCECGNCGSNSFVMYSTHRSYRVLRCCVDGVVPSLRLVAESSVVRSEILRSKSIGSLFFQSSSFEGIMSLCSLTRGSDSISSGKSEIMTVDVVVGSRRGRVVHDLSLGDFKIKEPTPYHQTETAGPK